MNVKKIKDKKISFLLILVLLVSLMPILSLASQTDSGTEITYSHGKYVDVNEDGSIDINNGNGVTGYDDPEQTVTGGANGNLYVNYSKSITETATPGQYKITLNVETNEELDEIYVPSNVVIVMDVSGSMDSNDYNGKSRWKIFKEAMEEFITDFLSKSPENKVSISIFGGVSSTSNNNYKTVVHKEIMGWTNSTSSAINSFNKSSASNMRQTYLGDTASNSKFNFTNGQAAFRAAYETLTTNNAVNVPDQYTSVIVMTDGEFNRNYETANTDADSSANQNNAINESAKITALKNNPSYKLDNIDLYTLAINTASKPINHNQNTNIKQTFYALDNNIDTIIYNLYKTIQGSVQCWQVTDPMSDYVNYKAGSAQSAKAGTVTYSSEDKTLYWNLLEEIPTSSGGVGSSAYYVYSMSYVVTVDTDAIDDGDLWDEFVPANKQTELTYAFVVNKQLGDTKSTLFRIPTVKANAEPEQTYTYDISKIVVGDGAPSNDTFDFIVKVGGTLYEGEYKIGTGPELTMLNGELTLKGGETATLLNLAAGNSVNVMEKSKLYYQADESIKEGSVSGETNNRMVFTNTYAKPDLRIEKTSDPESDEYVYADNEITYKLKVVNDSDVTATGIVIKDSIPADTTYVSFGDTNYEHIKDGDVLKWFVGDLAPKSESDIVTFVVSVNDTEFEVIENIGYYKESIETTSKAAFDAEGDYNESNIVHHYPAQPDMTISKANKPGDGETINIGEDITYYITINNTGNVPLKNIWVEDSIPEFTKYKASSVKNDGEYISNGNYVRWLIDEIVVENSITLEFTVTVDADTPADTRIKNVALAEVLGDDAGIPEEGKPSKKTNEVTNIVGGVLGDEEKDDEGEVQGQERFDDTNQTVLGEEAKTNDPMSSLLPLLIMGGSALAVLLYALWRMTRREE